jgi:7,8-dihydropterin-6-yl-methyl-4-(beta-D-ribofuranosyl)aminobenzene 5'-phosphate synthase
VDGFLLDAAGHRADPLVDDQALFVETPEGLIVIVGCGHAGIQNTLDHVCALSNRREVYALIGGMHLSGATQERLLTTANAIGRRSCRILAPCHCTGLSAHAYLRARFHSLVRDAGVGARLVMGCPEKN